MKITTVSGVLTATAETKEDVRVLLSLDEKAKPTTQYPIKRPRKIVGGHYRKECPVCHEKFRNLKMHTMRSHEGRNWATRGTPAVVPVTS